MNEAKRLLDTTAAPFSDPQDVVYATELTTDEKLVVLRQWKSRLERLGRKRPPTIGARPETDSQLAAVVDAMKELHRSAT